MSSEPNAFGNEDLKQCPRQTDHTALDPESKYYDPKSTQEQPRWYMVDVQLAREMKRNIRLQAHKQHSQFASMKRLQRGNRLSIMPVTNKAWNFILLLE